MTGVCKPYFMEAIMKTGIVIKCSILILCLLVLTGCATTKQPPSSQIGKMALSRAAVEKASSAGAYEYAPLELKTARDKIELAKAATQSKDYVTAERLLEQATVDAELAEARSKTAKSQKVVDELKMSIDMLREEIQRRLP